MHIQAKLIIEKNDNLRQVKHIVYSENIFLG